VPDLSENDPRVYLAAERTLLAWIRTGLAMDRGSFRDPLVQFADLRPSGWHSGELYRLGLQKSIEAAPLLSLFVNRLRTVLAVKGSLRRAETARP
jgi:uncharacterized membrane protein YidH (DUF202 family)